MLDPSSVAELAVAAEAFAEAGDRARARATLPMFPHPRRWLSGGRLQPAAALGTWERHVRYATRRDPDDLAALVAKYRPHAVAKARRVHRHIEPVDDLVQVALEALVLALKRFDPERRVPFLAFAMPTVTGSLRRHFRDLGWGIRVPRRAHELAKPIQDARDALAHDLRRMPTVSEIADLLGLDEAEVHATVRAQEARAVAPIDAAGFERAGPAGGGEDSEADLTRVENQTALRQILVQLPPDERHLLHLYFVEERTQAEIAEQIGVSQMQVSRLLRRTLRLLRARLLGT